MKGKKQNNEMERGKGGKERGKRGNGKMGKEKKKGEKGKEREERGSYIPFILFYFTDFIAFTQKSSLATAEKKFE
jgi:hypothetical protein